ncbi:hypothetical protein [Halorussus sp. MSC15.2]|uniref:hypothetical protein n=1 Tax=Halorussus sp. MSC15.2 TaxID=2283638 RepID=UPI0013D2EA6B|nr:hypothetical protein [Halorussus sp. MSC15.2]NEU55298.1 hypothetical protein [Halorussus sp. MSC15.2]
MSQHGDPDAQVDEFLELERELSAGRRASETYEEGNISEAAKIPASEVPDDYPVAIRTRQALQLNVETPDGETVATYLEWPGEDEESDHVGRLLGALGRERDEFANVYGDRVALDSENGWHGIDAERTAAMRGAKLAAGDESLDRSRNLLAGALGAGLLAIPVGVLSEMFAGLLLMVSLVGIPAGIYLDGKRLEDATGRSVKTALWTVGGAVPLLNYSVAIAYLLDRRVTLSGPTSGEGSERWYKGIFASLAAIPVAVALSGLSEATAGMVLFVGWTFLPFAVYFDAEYVEETTDWDPNEELWAIAVIVFGLFAAVPYLVKRRVELD